MEVIRQQINHWRDKTSDKSVKSQRHSSGNPTIVTVVGLCIKTSIKCGGVKKTKTKTRTHTVLITYRRSAAVRMKQEAERGKPWHRHQCVAVNALQRVSAQCRGRGEPRWEESPLNSSSHMSVTMCVSVCVRVRERHTERGNYSTAAAIIHHSSSWCTPTHTVAHCGYDVHMHTISQLLNDCRHQWKCENT